MNTLEKLQQPTMALIGSFYSMNDDVRSFFVDMLSIYEQEPTQEVANMLFDKVMGKESPEEKKKWIREKASTVPLPLRKRTAEKYIGEKQAVPKGIPTSGNVLVGLNIVSRADKEALMEAQAAARILNHLEQRLVYQMVIYYIYLVVIKMFMNIKLMKNGQKLLIKG